MDTNGDSAYQSQNEDNFPTFPLGLEFLNKAEKRKTTEKGDTASAPSRFASLHLIYGSYITCLIIQAQRIW